jgi:hypothetical protein
MARVNYAGVTGTQPYPDLPSDSGGDRLESREEKQEPEFIFCDWDQEELDAVRRCGLKYTIRRYIHTVSRI